jgi:hypothetical protein
MFLIIGNQNVPLGLHLGMWSGDLVKVDGVFGPQFTTGVSLPQPIPVRILAEKNVILLFVTYENKDEDMT